MSVVVVGFVTNVEVVVVVVEVVIDIGGGGFNECGYGWICDWCGGGGCHGQSWVCGGGVRGDRPKTNWPIVIN